jgi:outer membrane protein assembly factor BamA
MGSIKRYTLFSHRTPDWCRVSLVMKSRLFLSIAVGCVSVPALFSDPIINSIQIERLPVFEGEDLHPVQKAANLLHVTTKEHVISNELLFAEGEPLDPELLEETERKLRRFDFIERVDISATNASINTVDVKVVTQDQWSLIPSLIVESGGGLANIGGALTEHNLLGLGKFLTLEAVYESDVGTTYGLDYYDPQLFGSEYEAELNLTSGPLEESVHISVWRPFKSLESPWSYGADGYYSDHIDRLFNDGEEVSRIGANDYGFSVDGSYAWGERLKRQKLRLRYKYKEETYHPLGTLTTTPLPEDQTSGTLSTKYSINKHRYVEETRIDSFNKVEDLVMGRTTSVGVGKAGFPIPRGEDWWEYSFGHDHALQFGEDQYLFADLGFSSQTIQNTILDMDSQYYWQWGGWQTLAFNFEFVQGWDLRENRQFILGAQSGLRGYPARAFNGDKRMVFNLESRQFWAKRVMTVELGSVLFVDVGNAWKRNETINLEELNAAAGFGFRFGLTKMPGSTVVRLDLGWPVNNPGEMQVTLGTGQYF